ncbi:MAG: UDP-N-acetylglucosamine 1-carboxyvinyltransferase [Patescibacteria group bacterium]
MAKFTIHGGQPLRGTVAVAGSKNAALPGVAATILASRPVTLTNVPLIADVATMIDLLSWLGARVTRRGHTVTIDPRGIKNRPLPHERVSRLRASILLAGPLLARFGEVTMDFPGGCVIGKRPIDAHLKAFEALGAQVVSDGERLHARAKRGLKANSFMMWETSVTATENAVMAAAATVGKTQIRLAAAEPHVQNLCHLLVKMGARISGIGTNTLVIQGRRRLGGTTHRINGDYLEMGTLAIAAALVPKSRLTITGVDPTDLDSFWNKFTELGGHVSRQPGGVTVTYASGLKALPKLETRVYPGFPTDLQAPFSVLLTQAKGVTKIFETLFEGRFGYLAELEKMGAKVEVYNPHQALVIGRTPLRGAVVDSCDLRAGATVVLAGLAATGTTEVYNISYIDRGYERFDAKLRQLGADIQRVED